MSAVAVGVPRSADLAQQSAGRTRGNNRSAGRRSPLSERRTASSSAACRQPTSRSA
jgi:hypothetical protein